MKKTTDVLIVGGGPSGMVLSSMLNHFGVSNLILERQNKVQDHPKAHYISFRTCEILKDLGMHIPLEQKLNQIKQWANFNYKSHVLGGKTFGKVNHIQWLWKKCGSEIKSMPTETEDYLNLLKEFQSSKGFTYAYPNHFSQNLMTELLH